MVLRTKYRTTAIRSALFFLTLADQVKCNGAQQNTALDNLLDVGFIVVRMAECPVGLEKDAGLKLGSFSWKSFRVAFVFTYCKTDLITA